MLAGLCNHVRYCLLCALTAVIAHGVDEALGNIVVIAMGIIILLAAFILLMLHAIWEQSPIQAAHYILWLIELGRIVGH